MYYNREKELHKQKKYHEGWNISKKYTDILMLHSENDRNIDMCFAIHSQYMNELRDKKLNYQDSKNYVQVWNTMMNTVLKNVDSKGAVRLLHQTSQQRSYKKI